MLLPIAPHVTIIAPDPFANRLKTVVPVLTYIRPRKRRATAGIRLCRILLALFAFLAFLAYYALASL